MIDLGYLVVYARWGEPGLPGLKGFSYCGSAAIRTLYLTRLLSWFNAFVAKEDAIEMFVGGLVLDPATQAPIVVLKDETGKLVLPIWIGVAEATSIASVIKNLNLVRPMTHDLMYTALEQLGAKVQRALITDLKDSTYFSELVLSVGERAVILDARPSDAIAVALRASAPIYVMPHVLDQARVAFITDPGHGQGSPEEGGKGQVEEAEEGKLDERDLKNIDKDKWAEILAELDPDDFKYKM